MWWNRCIPNGTQGGVGGQSLTLGAQGEARLKACNFRNDCVLVLEIRKYFFALRPCHYENPHRFRSFGVFLRTTYRPNFVVPVTRRKPASHPISFY